MKKISLFLAAIIILLLGCAEVKTPSPDVVFHPWSALQDIKIGDTKDNVRDKWGNPDQINSLGKDEFGIEKEEWVYRGRMSVPMDDQYLSKTKYLYFDGKNLTEITSQRRQQTKEAK